MLLPIPKFLFGQAFLTGVVRPLLRNIFSAAGATMQILHDRYPLVHELIPLLCAFRAAYLTRKGPLVLRAAIDASAHSLPGCMSYIGFDHFVIASSNIFSLKLCLERIALAIARSIDESLFSV